MTNVERVNDDDLSGTRLICPRHPPDDRYYLEERGDRAFCADCGYDCQNFLKYPVVQVYDMRTGEIRLRNILERPSALRPDRSPDGPSQ